MSTSSVLGLLLIAAVAIFVALYEMPGGLRHELCPRPVVVQGHTVSCDGTMPAPDPSPRSRQ